MAMKRHTRWLQQVVLLVLLQHARAYELAPQKSFGGLYNCSVELIGRLQTSIDDG